MPQQAAQTLLADYLGERERIVFNIKGNRYRLIVAIHYDRQLVYVLRFLTHAEYSKDMWKNQL